MWQGSPFPQSTPWKCPLTSYFLQIEAWCEQNYPSFVHLSSEAGKKYLNTADVRSKVVLANQELDLQIQKNKVQNGAANGLNGVNGYHLEGQQDDSSVQMLFYIGGGFSLILAISMGLLWAATKYSA